MSINGRGGMSTSIAASAQDAYVAFDERPFSVDAKGHGGDDGDAKAATMGSSVFNLSNTILGASTLAIAFACRELGLIVFLVLLVLFGALANFSIQLLTRSLTFSDRETYGDIGYEAMGRFGEMLALCCVVVQQIGACIAYVDVIGDVLEPIVAHIDTPYFDTRVFWQITTVVVVIFPLCMLKKMDSLRVSSLVAVILICMFAIVVMIDGISSASSDNLGKEFNDHAIRLFPDSAINALQVVPVICFAFVCHMNVFPIYQELKDRSIGKMDKVGWYAIMICFVVYAMAGSMGYIGFKTEVCDDLLDTYNDHSILVPSAIVKVVQIGIGIALIFSFPVLAFELRHCVDALFFPHSNFSWVRHTLENVCIIIIALAVGILVPVVVTVFGFIGATTSTLIVFVMPPLFYLRIETASLSNELVAAQGLMTRKMRRGIAWFELIMGVLLIPTCLTALTLAQVDGSSDTC